MTAIAPTSRCPTKLKVEHHNEGIKTVCWNCRTTGHRFKNCEKTITIFCCKCGQPNAQSWAIVNQKMDRRGNIESSSLLRCAPLLTENIVKLPVFRSCDRVRVTDIMVVLTLPHDFRLGVPTFKKRIRRHRCRADGKSCKKRFEQRTIKLCYCHQN